MPDETRYGPETEAKERRKLPLKSLLILAAIMLLEGGLFALWMTFADPKNARGAGSGDSKPADTIAELVILRFRAPSRKTGRLVLYDMEIAIECDKDDVELVKAICTKRDAYIRDQLRSIIAKADPQYFHEDQLQTLKRQIRVVFDELFGEERIRSVLIPECTPFRTD